jgi:adenine-specific DNA-methyltransferase
MAKPDPVEPLAQAEASRKKSKKAPAAEAGQGALFGEDK